MASWDTPLEDLMSSKRCLDGTNYEGFKPLTKPFIPGIQLPRTIPLGHKIRLTEHLYIKNTPDYGICFDNHGRFHCTCRSKSCTKIDKRALNDYANGISKPTCPRLLGEMQRFFYQPVHEEFKCRNRGGSNPCSYAHNLWKSPDGKLWRTPKGSFHGCTDINPKDYCFNYTLARYSRTHVCSSCNMGIQENRRRNAQQIEDRFDDFLEEMMQDQEFEISAPPTKINLISTTTVDRCEVCLEEQLPAFQFQNCSHKLCIACTESWLRRAGNCHLCRAPIFLTPQQPASPGTQSRRLEQPVVLDPVSSQVTEEEDTQELEVLGVPGDENNSDVFIPTSPYLLPSPDFAVLDVPPIAIVPVVPNFIPMIPIKDSCSSSVVVSDSSPLFTTPGFFDSPEPSSFSSPIFTTPPSVILSETNRRKLRISKKCVESFAKEHSSEITEASATDDTSQPRRLITNREWKERAFKLRSQARELREQSLEHFYEALSRFNDPFPNFKTCRRRAQRRQQKARKVAAEQAERIANLPYLIPLPPDEPDSYQSPYPRKRTPEQIRFRRKVRRTAFGRQYRILRAEQLRAQEKKILMIQRARDLLRAERARDQEIVTIQVPTKVGGESDCWKKLIKFKGPKHNEMLSILEIRELVKKIMFENFNLFVSRPGAQEIAKEFLGFEPKNPNNFVKELRPVYMKMLYDAYVLLVLPTEKGHLHIVDVRCRYDEEIDIQYWNDYREQYLADGYETLQFFLTRPQTQPQSFTQDGTPEYILVGSSNIEAIEESCRAIEGPSIVKGHVSTNIHQELKSRIRTRYHLTSSEKLLASKYLGMPITCDSTKPSGSDHVQLQVARDIATTYIAQSSNVKEDTLPTFHVGATFLEFKLFRSRPNHVMQFHNTEAKDTIRTVSPFLNYIGSTIQSKKLPALAAVSGSPSIKIKVGNLADAVALNNKLIANYEQVIIDDRIPKAMKLTFLDNLYGMSQEQFLNYWKKSGAIEGYATLFAPSELVDNQHAGADFYELVYDYDFGNFTESTFDAIWPEVLFITPLLNSVAIPVEWRDEDNTYLIGDVIAKQIRLFFKRLFTLQQSAFKRFILDGTMHSEFWPEVAVNIAVDIVKYASLYSKWSDRILSFLRDRFRVVSVIWKNSYQNGYRHLERHWKHWIHERVYEDNEISIASEVVQRYGEMWVIRFFRTTTCDPIIWRPSVPDHLRRMKILDFEKSIDRGLKVLNFKKEVWTSCKESDFYEVLAWGNAEPKDSLDFQTVVAACNRVRKGLSLISNTSHEGLDIKDNEVLNFALAVYLRIHRDSNWAEEYTKSPSIASEYTSNFKNLCWKVLAGTAIIGTCGLVIPAAMLLNWLIKGERTLEFVKEPETPPIRVYKPKPRSVKNITDVQFQLEVLPTETNSDEKCFVCAVQKRGGLGKQIVRSEKCTHAAEPVQCGLTAQEAAQGRLLIEKLIDDHRSMVSESTISANRLFESFLSSNSTQGTSHQATFHYIQGGPGTGKSVLARELMNDLEIGGVSCGMYLPLATLKSDYDSVALLDGSHKTFDADTFFKMGRYKNFDVLFVDEFTLCDELHFKCYLNYVRATHVVLVGDHLQQHKSPQVSPGPGLGEGHIFQYPMSKHELQVNFRFNDIYRVLLLNKLYGYHMIPNGTDREKKITFMNQRQYSNIKKSDKPKLELVFAHATANDAFGKTSTNIGTGLNMSVYAHQGVTVETSALSCFDQDISTIPRHGVLNVAISRSKDPPIIVCHDVNSQVAQDLRRELYLDTDDRYNEVLNSRWPDPGNKASSDLFVPSSDRPMNTFLLTQKHNLVYSNTFPSTHEADKPHKKKTIVLDDPVPPGHVLVIDQEKADEREYEFQRQAIQDVLELCTLDALPTVADKLTYIQLVIRPFMENEKHRVLGDWNNGFRLYTGKDKKFINFGPIEVDFTDRDPIQPNGRLQKMHIPESDFLGFLAGHYQDYMLCRSLSLFRQNPEFYRSHSVVIVGDINQVGDRIFELSDRHVERRTADWVQKEAKVGIHCLIADQRIVRMPWYRHNGRYIADEALLQHPVRLNPLGKLPPSIKIANPNPLTKLERDRNIWTEEPRKTHVWNQDVRYQHFQKPPPTRHKLRLGHHSYRLCHLLDASEALPIRTNFDSPNNIAVAIGPNMAFKDGFKVDLTKTMFGRTKKAKKIRRKKPDPTRSFVPGYGSTFTGGIAETFNALTRVTGKRPNRPLSEQGKQFWRELTRKAWHELHTKVQIDLMEQNSIIHDAWRAYKTRNYGQRAEIERTSGKNFLTRIVTNKKQYKPPKNGIDHFKAGQAISQTSASWNILHGAAMRVLNLAYKRSLKQDVFYENLESQSSFKIRLSAAIRKLPLSTQFAILDGTEFDAGQTAGTVFAEMEHRRLMGCLETYLQSYYQCRKPTKFRYYEGGVTGRTDYEKGSGFLDTLLGNTTLTEIIGNSIIRGQGPKVVAMKGDDFMKAQSNLYFDTKLAKLIQLHSNLKLKHQIGNGAEYCGMTVSREGCYSSITRVALKAIATRFRDLKHFQEYQISLRDKLKEMKHDGFNETVASNMIANKANRNTVELAWAVADSISHLSGTQFHLATKRRIEIPIRLPQRDRKRNIFTFV